MSQDPGAAGAPGRSAQFEILIAVAIAVVSLATAIAAWRSSDLSSKAGDAEREGLIESVQDQSLRNEDWRLTLEQAANAKRYFAAEAEADALEASGDEVGAAQAQAMRQYLLPSLALLAGRLPFSVIGGAVLGGSLIGTVAVLVG